MPQNKLCSLILKAATSTQWNSSEGPPNHENTMFCPLQEKAHFSISCHSVSSSVCQDIGALRYLEACLILLFRADGGNDGAQKEMKWGGGEAHKKKLCPGGLLTEQ